MTTKNSTEVTNFEAVPQIYTATQNAHGRMRVAQGNLEVATTDIDDDDIIMLAVVPAEASVLHIYLGSDDLDSGTPALAFDLGVYTTAGVVKDRDAFASAITLGQAAAKGVIDFANEARDISEIGQKLYLDAGDTQASHDNQYYIALTGETVADTAVGGTISYIIEYVVD